MSQASMYASVMGEAFHLLAAPVQKFHTYAGTHEFRGEVRVDAPANLPAKLLAACLGAPLKAAQGPIRFELLATPDCETWTRFFPGKTMRSTLRRSGNRVTERLGASRLSFALLEVDGALEMRLDALHFLGIPCPRWLMPQIVARETGEHDKFHFQIQASVPGIGVVAGYTGYLDLPGHPIP